MQNTQFVFRTQTRETKKEFSGEEESKEKWD